MVNYDGGSRILSVRYTQPENPAIDDIYVSFEYVNRGIEALAVSSNDFLYQGEQVRRTSRIVNHIDYNDFIKELAEENSARIENLLFEEGLNAVHSLEETARESAKHDY